jgi:hypothetical protein
MLNSPNRHVPDLPQYIRGDQILQRGRTISNRSFQSSPEQLELCTESRATPRGVPRALPTFPSSSSSPTRRRPHRWRAKDKHRVIPYQISPLHSIVTLNLGALEYKDPQIAGRRALIAHTRINLCVPRVIFEFFCILESTWATGDITLSDIRQTTMLDAVLTLRQSVTPKLSINNAQTFIARYINHTNMEDRLIWA